VPKFAKPIRCYNCGSIFVIESESRGVVEATCGSCGSLRIRVSMDDAYEFKGYWRGICPNCGSHISSYIYSKEGKDYIVCGECFRMSEVSKAETFEVRDIEGKVVKYDKDKEIKRLVLKV